MELKVYDKAAWHIENSDKSTVVGFFSKLMDFLKSHNYLNNDGLEIYELGVDPSISITSKMLTEEGNAVLSASYDKFLASYNGNSNPNFSMLDK
jgi:hypothetical protein